MISNNYPGSEKLHNVLNLLKNQGFKNIFQTVKKDQSTKDVSQNSNYKFLIRVVRKEFIQAKW